MIPLTVCELGVSPGCILAVNSMTGFSGENAYEGYD